MAVTGDNSTFKASFRRNLVDSFIKSFDIGQTDKYFLFVGKVDGWTAGGTFGSISDTRSDDIDVWRNVIGIKQIDSNASFRMIDRYDWTNNTIYTPYDNTIDLKGQKYYVMNSEYSVYKCLSNNGGIASSVEPTGVQTDTPIRTSEGYVWKYIYTVPEPLRYYIDDEFIPVNKLVAKGTSKETANQWSTQRHAIDGSIDIIKIDTVNGDYTSDLIVASGSTASTLLDGATAGATHITLNGKNFGSAYGESDDDFNGLTITITSGLGSGQRRAITDYVAATNTVHFTEPLVNAIPKNSTYEIAPKVDIYGDGVSAEAFVELYEYDTTNTERKKIRNIVLTNKGKDYSYATIELTPEHLTNASASSSQAAELRAIIGPEGGHGSDASTELKPTALLVVVNIDRDEDSAFFTSNEVRQYGIIKNPILNDTNPIYLNSNGNPYRIAGETISQKTFIEIAPRTEEKILPESLYTVGNYIIGKDTKSTAKIEAWNPSMDSNRGVLTVSNVQGNFKPPFDVNGTGEGVIEFSQSVDDWAYSAASDVAAVSGFDRIYQNTTPSFSCTTVLGVSGENLDTEDFPVDIGVTGGSAVAGGCTGCPTATVVNWVPDTTGTGGTLTLTNVKGSFATGDSIGRFSAASTTTLIHTVAEPEIKPFTGEIIYAQNMMPIEKDPEQREQYQIILKF